LVAPVKHINFPAQEPENNDTYHEPVGEQEKDIIGGGKCVFEEEDKL
jgi:hypothetical protein